VNLKDHWIYWDGFVLSAFSCFAFRGGDCGAGGLSGDLHYNGLDA
jgi:hypothetical protein